MNDQKFDVAVFDKNHSRFVLVDSVTNKVLDDANGYGYTTKQKAMKAGWYKFQKGKSKIDGYKKFWKDHSDAAKYLEDILEMNIKELSRGEVTNQEILDEVNAKFNLKITPSHLRHLDF